MRKDATVPVIVLLMLIIAGLLIVLNNDGNDPNSPDGGDGTGDGNNQIGDDWDVYYVDSGDDLPACGSATIGRLYYVASTAGFEACTSAGWAFVDLTGPAGPTGANGTDGAQGPAGSDGTDGSDGTEGSDGTNGTDGQDGVQGSPGPVGEDGMDGVDGMTALAVTTVESVGSNCTDGGLKIEVGVDVNGNGSLEANEVDHTQYICNGADGVNGSASNNTMLTSISSPAASLGCTAGGRVMKQGLDNGDGGGTTQNGVLESGEVDYTTTYCSTYEFWQVDDIQKGGDSGTPGWNTDPILIGDTLYFDANDGVSGYELWAHDTSNSSTWQVSDINQGNGHSSPGLYAGFTLVGDTIYFDASFSGMTTGVRLWAYTISNESIWQASSITSVGLYSRSITNVGNTLYFSGGSHQDLWAYGITNSSTWEVTDINPGSNSHVGQYSGITLLGTTLYFCAYDGTSVGYEMWAHDTSNSSTWRVTDISNYSSSFPGDDTGIIAVGTALYFNAVSGQFDNNELWVHETTNSSTWEVADINVISSTSNSNPGEWSGLTLIGDTLFFDANDGVNGIELWAHNTSNSSTWLVADIDSGGSSFPGQYMDILVGDTLYFSASDGISGRELWAHDTSNSSTWKVANFNSGGSSNPGQYMDILVGDTLYFSANDGSSGHELWAMMIEHNIIYN